MNRFIIRVLLFGLIFFVYDKLFIIVTIISPETEVDKRIELIVKGKINKDVIVLGSSRGARDIIASQIEDKTSLSAYNLCYPGANIEFHEFILQTLVKYNSPPGRVLFVVDDYSELIADETIIFRYDRLYPLVKYSWIKEELIKRGKINKNLSRFLILPQLNIRNLDLRKKKFSPLDTIFRCGSMPISFQREGRKWIFGTGERKYPKNEENEAKVDSFKKCIKICEQNNIRFTLIFPPNYQNISRSFVNRLKEISGNNVDLYIYNTENPVYRNKDYYYDESHLMRKGAILFTDEVINYLNGQDKTGN
jgi:hypothetical protein